MTMTSILLGALAALPLAALPLAAAADGDADDASFIDASIRLDGTLLDWAFVDIDMDGQDELALSVRTPRGGRELRLHRTTARSITPEPYGTIPILKDIVAWTFADVRPELEGRELVLLTRQGAWSFDPRQTAYRGNIAPLAKIDLLYDVPSPRALPYWSYVLQFGADERLLLPDRNGFRVFGPDPGAGEGDMPWHAHRTYRRTSGWTPPDPSDNKRRQREAEREAGKREARLELTIGDRVAPFMGSGAGQNLIEDDFRIQAPAMVDLDGDGLRDMLLLDGDFLRIYMAGPDGLPERPSRSEALPEYLTRSGQRAALRLVDVDGDGRRDVVGIWSEKFEGLKNIDWRVLVMRSTRGRLFPEKPSQVLRFKAAALRAVIEDIDGDGRPDLAVRSFELPTVLESVTGLEFKYSQLLYLGNKRATFDRKPALKKTETYDEESVRAVLANRELRLDCSGDGVADLVEVNLKGELGVRRLRKSSSFFGGTSWEIDEGYWKQYASRGSVSSLTVTDLNGDGLGDIVSASDSILTIYLSQRR